MIRKVGCNEFLLAFFNRRGGAVTVRIMKGILKKNGLTADKSLNSVLNSSPPIKCYYYTQFSWVFKNHVISQCEGLFQPAFSLAEKSPENKVGYRNLLAVFCIFTGPLPPSSLSIKLMMSFNTSTQWLIIIQNRFVQHVKVAIGLGELLYTGIYGLVSHS